MNKLSIMNEIDEMLDTYCEGCFVKRQVRKDHGKTAAHRFCISKCTVGSQLQFLGEELNKIGTSEK
ncbi:zinc-finger domain-containing protein [Planomicrobium sp. CPCC 101110]|uniref:zinc-finger domain-containing protein n=1 Tax=Planomicrobium sp. CPCC 101110 TaxID=2599619 RepID=UPI0011B66853|nr:zinc-finger domain-containing protein [Planomicrobium sp. CPCC 101110]TWT28371.1 zinc-finger domain-containing protein [Planomicrobium sp. CPCC 101110]